MTKHNVKEEFAADIRNKLTIVHTVLERLQDNKPVSKKIINKAMRDVKIITRSLNKIDSKS